MRRSRTTGRSGTVSGKWDATPHPMAQCHLYDSWTEGDDVVFVLYAFPGIDALIGLRRRVSTGLPLEEEVDDIVNFEIGEPLGRYFTSALIVDGVFWWDGGPPTQFDWDRRREAAARLAESRTVQGVNSPGLRAPVLASPASDCWRIRSPLSSAMSMAADLGLYTAPPW